jgi:hypothetical protein
MPAVCEATVTRVTAGAAATAGLSINGCVFFICTEAGDGTGSGNTAIRAVSFLGLTDGVVSGNGAAGAFGLGAFDFVANGAGGGTNRGACTGLFGAGGINGLAIGGRGVPAPGGFAGRGGGLGGGRDGKVIRTVSRASAGFAAGGVTATRTVSFFGSVGSAIRRCESAKTLPENRRFVTL